MRRCRHATRLVVTLLFLVAGIVLQAHAGHGSLLTSQEIERADDQDGRRAIELTAQAESVLLTQVPSDGSDLAVLFGMPSDQQVQHAVDGASKALQLLRSARKEAESAIFRLERRPGFQQDDAMLQRRNLLQDEYLGTRIPVFESMALILEAVAVTPTGQRPGDDPGRLQRLNTAITLLEPLGRKLSGQWRGLVLQWLGIGQVLAGQPGAADESFQLLGHELSEQTPTPLQVRLARVMIADARSSLAGRQAGMELQRELPDQALAEQVLLVDLMTRMLLQVRAGSDDLARPWIRLMERSSPGTRMATRNTAIDRLGRLADKGMLEGGTLPLVRLVQARRLLDRDPEGALGLLGDIDTDDPLMQPMLQWSMARAQADRKQWLESARILRELAWNHPADPLATQGLEFSIEMLGQLEQVLLEADALTRLEQVREELLQTLQVALAIEADGLDAMELHLLGARIARETGDHRLAREFLQESDSDEQAVRLERARLSLAMARGTGVSLAQRNQHAEDGLGQLQGDRAEPTLEQVMLASELMLARGHAHQAMANLDKIPLQDAMQSDSADEFINVRIRCLQACGRLEEARSLLGDSIKLMGDRGRPLLESTIDSMLREHHELMRKGRDDDADALARGQLLQLGHILHDMIRISLEEADAMMTVGQVYMAAGMYEEALSLYDQLLAEGGPARPFLMGKAESLYGLGSREQLAEAMLIYRRLTTANEVRDGQWWLCELRKLQILEAVDGDDGKILARIRQLQLIDPQMGGAPVNREFRKLRDRISAAMETEESPGQGPGST